MIWFRLRASFAKDHRDHQLLFGQWDRAGKGGLGVLKPLDLDVVAKTMYNL